MKDPTVIQSKRLDVYSCTVTTPLLSAAQQMCEEDISALVVIDEGGYLAGIITRVDLLRARYASEQWTKQLVQDWMNRQVVTVNPKDRLSQVARLLLDKQIHRVVAVHEEGEKKRPVAVISAADLIYHMVKEETS